MKVTIVDSEPSVVALIDCLNHLPTQPPSLYLDVEGVNLSRHGSISILQLFVLPKNHVFLIDVFVLQEKAFGTPNPSGTSLRSILESALVPKVFFDVRNDSDALFAHFHISMQGIQDVQLLENATRGHSKERLAGLARCIDKDARLTPKASAAWKATKQKGHSLFAPEHGGSYDVFNARPMLQDIVDYCTQDVVYLPLLRKVYSRKISTAWMKKVQDETCDRIRVSQTALYEPHGKNKSLSPWANSAELGQGNCIGKTETTGLGKKVVAAVPQDVATEAAKKTAAVQPDAEPQYQPSVGETDIRRSPRLTASKAAQETSKTTVELEGPPSKPEFPIRSKNERARGSHENTDPAPCPATVPSNWTCASCRQEMQEDQREKHLASKKHIAGLQRWTCVTCGREMQEDQKEEHLAGKPHTARVKRTVNAAVEAARQNVTAREKTLQTTTVTIESPQTGVAVTEPKIRHQDHGRAKDTGTNTRKKQAAVAKSQQRGLPYPSDHLFVGFRGSVASGKIQYETPFSLGGDNYALCDKDCGWCGHCMDGVDI